MVNFLFTCAGRRVELVREFRKYTSTCGSRVVTVDSNSLAPAGRFSDAHYLAPRYDDQQYIPFLLEICKKELINALIPLMEPEFPLLAEYREVFLDQGTLLILSLDKVINICKDKYQTHQFFCANGISSPQTFLPNDPELRETSFPLFIKPRSGMGSANIFKVNNKKELDFFIKYIPNPIIQEYIEGTEYTMDVLNDLHGNTIAVVPRERIEVRSGEVSKSRTVKDWKLIEQTKAVAEALGGIGPLTIQAFKKPTGEIIFTEINPRFGGGVPLAIEAGVDYPLLLAKMVAGEKMPPQLGEFRDNLYMLRYDEALYVDNIREAT